VVEPTSISSDEASDISQISVPNFVYVEIAPDFGPTAPANDALPRIRQAQSAALQLPGAVPEP